MDTIVENVQRENRTGTVRTAKISDMPLKNVTAIRSTVNNAHNVTIRVTKKSSAVRNKNMIKKKKRKILMSLKIYKEIEKMFVDDSGSTSHMLNSLKI